MRNDVLKAIGAVILGIVGLLVVTCAFQDISVSKQLTFVELGIVSVGGVFFLGAVAILSALIAENQARGGHLF